MLDRPGPVTIQQSFPEVRIEDGSHAGGPILGLGGGTDQEESEAEADASSGGSVTVERRQAAVEAIHDVTDALQHHQNEDYDSDNSATSEETLWGGEELPPKEFLAESVQAPSDSTSPPHTKCPPPSNPILQPPKIHHSVPQDPQLLRETIEALEGLSRDKNIDLIFRG